MHLFAHPTPSAGVTEQRVSPTPSAGVKSPRIILTRCAAAMHLFAPPTPSAGVTEQRVFPTPSAGVRSPQSLHIHRIAAFHLPSFLSSSPFACLLRRQRFPRFCAIAVSCSNNPAHSSPRGRHCTSDSFHHCTPFPSHHPTFGRCAESPCFRPTFGRSVGTSQHREHPVSVFLLPPCPSHLPKMGCFLTFSSHLWKVGSA